MDVATDFLKAGDRVVGPKRVCPVCPATNLKPLFLLCGAISRKTKIFFLKGRSANKEVKNAKVFWKKTFHHFEMKFPDQDQLASQKLVQETLVEKNVVPFGCLLSYL